MVDYSQAYEFIYRIDKRVSALEKDATLINELIDTTDRVKKKKFDTLQNEMDVMLVDLKTVKESLSQATHAMVELSKDMKLSVNKDQLDQLAVTIEEIPFDTMVTRKELERL